MVHQLVKLEEVRILNKDLQDMYFDVIESVSQGIHILKTQVDELTGGELMTTLEGEFENLRLLVMNLQANYHAVAPCILIPFFSSSRKKRLRKECQEIKCKIEQYLSDQQDVLHKYFIENPHHRRKSNQSGTSETISSSAYSETCPGKAPNPPQWMPNGPNKKGKKIPISNLE